IVCDEGSSLLRLFKHIEEPEEIGTDFESEESEDENEVLIENDFEADSEIREIEKILNLKIIDNELREIIRQTKTLGQDLMKNDQNFIDDENEFIEKENYTDNEYEIGDHQS
ncbi:unnamed protein product, partial [Brachionus calyciflorus]